MVRERELIIRTNPAMTYPKQQTEAVERDDPPAPSHTSFPRPHTAGLSPRRDRGSARNSCVHSRSFEPGEFRQRYDPRPRARIDQSGDGIVSRWKAHLANKSRLSEHQCVLRSFWMVGSC